MAYGMGYFFSGIVGMISVIIDFFSDYYSQLPQYRYLVIQDLPWYIIFFVIFALLVVYDRLLRSEKGRKFLRKIPIKAIQRKANDISRTIANRDEFSEENKQETKE